MRVLFLMGVAILIGSSDANAKGKVFYTGFAIGRADQSANSVPVEKAIGTLNEVWSLSRTVSWGWGNSAYATISSAAAFSGRPVSEALSLLNEVYANREQIPGGRGWSNTSYATIAGGALVSGKSATQALVLLAEIYRIAGNYRYGARWTEEAYANVASAALIADVSATTAIEALDQIWAQSTGRSFPDWDENAYSMMAAAAIVSGDSPAGAIRKLDEVYEAAQTIAGGSGWSYQSYALVAGAALIAKIPAREAAGELVKSWRASSISEGWLYDAYAAAAAVGLASKK